MTKSEQFKTIRIEAQHINYQTDYQLQQDALKKNCTSTRCFKNILLVHYKYKVKFK